MKLFHPFILALLLFATHSCSTQETKVPTQSTPIVSAPDEDQFPDIQTLAENHKILTIRVSGDLSKISAATRSKIGTLLKSFDTAFEQFKTAIINQNDLKAKLKILEAEAGADAKKTPAWEEASKALQAATATAEQAQSDYDALTREFAGLIEMVKSERSKQ